jgi:threonine aldolase
MIPGTDPDLFNTTVEFFLANPTTGRIPKFFLELKTEFDFLNEHFYCMTAFNRRSFLKTSGAGILPALIPFSAAFAGDTKSTIAPAPDVSVVNLWADGLVFNPAEYLAELQKANTLLPIKADRYGKGGAVEALEKKFAEITGKEKAIYVPSGTMANQLAISVLSGENTKIFVQDTSHVYRDEADAAQSVFQKRLMPLAKGETYFTAQQLQTAIDNLKDEEVFKTGVGAVSIENPVRRKDGGVVPLDEIKKISTYCRANNIKMHLDGARIYIAAAWTNKPVKEYAAYFDTVYISLYKYLGAGGGAMLCGPADIIDKIPHLIKIHGGSIYQNWTNAAMALYRLEGIEQRFQNAIARSKELFAAINAIPGLSIKSIEGGSNIYTLTLKKEIDGKKLSDKLFDNFKIDTNYPNEKNEIHLTVNETIVNQTVEYIAEAFKKSI